MNGRGVEKVSDLLYQLSIINSFFAQVGVNSSAKILQSIIQRENGLMTGINSANSVSFNPRINLNIERDREKKNGDMELKPIRLTDVMDIPPFYYLNRTIISGNSYIIIDYIADDRKRKNDSFFSSFDNSSTQYSRSFPSS